MSLNWQTFSHSLYGLIVCRGSLSSDIFMFRICGEAVIPIKMIVLCARLALASKLIDPHDEIYDVEALGKKGKLRK